jgi:acetyl-CoA/propionyl-CoA carboxylase biotin carboxyl carrier protein
VILGVTTNTAFLRSLLQHPDVQAGKLDTGFIERHLDTLTSDEVPTEALAVYALRDALQRKGSDPWNIGWRPSGTAAQRWLLALPGGRTATVSLSGSTVTVDDVPLTATAALDGDDVLLTTHGRTTRWVTAVEHGTVWIGHEGAAWPITEAVRHLRGDDAGTHGGDVTSPMPGSVIAVHVAQGDAVTKGQPLVVVEAMKMEHTLAAPLDGTVGDVLVRVGQQVAVDELLISVGAGDAAVTP